MNSGQQQARSSRDAILLVKLGVAGGLIWWLVASGQLDFGQLATVGDRWHWFLLAQIPFGLVQLLSAWRWLILMRIQRIDYSLRDAFDLTLTGIFFNQVMIGSTGGDIYRAYAVCVEHPGKRSGGIVSVFVDRLVGLIALLLLVPVVLFWHVDLVRSQATLSFFAVVAIVVLIFLVVGTVLLLSTSFHNTAIVRWLSSRVPFPDVMKKANEAIQVHSHHKSAMTIVFLSSILIQLLIVAGNILFAVTLLGPTFAWIPFFLLIPMAHFAMAMPINPPGALGTGEAIYAYLLHYAEISQGGLICVLQRVTFLLWSIPGALLYIARPHHPAVPGDIAAEAIGFDLDPKTRKYGP